MSLTPTQQKVLDEVEKQGKAIVASIAAALEMTLDNAQRNLRFLTKTDYIHISEKDTSKPRVPVNIYAFGEGKKVQRKEWQLKQDAERKIRRNTYDPDAPIVENTGWVSTIHSKDYSFQHNDHIRFMQRFQPHPDVAAVWLFK